MSAKIITFPVFNSATLQTTPATVKVPAPDAPTSNGKVTAAERGSLTPSDGRRKKGAKSCSVEPNIQEIPGEDGRRSYRVQIRKSNNGKIVSFTKTFPKLSMARKWKKRKLAEIEIDGVQIQLKATDSVSYVTGAMEEDPEIVFAVTSEVAAQIGSDAVIDAGIENAALESAVADTLFEEAVSPFGALSLFRLLIGLPF